jgi:addiction module HigA family antidote
MNAMADQRDFPPPSPGDVLRTRVLKHMDVKQDALADALGVSRFTVNQVLNGRRGVSPEMALRLAHVLGTSAEMWLTLQARVDLFDARRRLGSEIESLPVLRSSDVVASVSDGPAVD